MKISARLDNSGSNHSAVVATSDSEKPVLIPAKDGGGGSSVNGGELLCLALATCYCNDIYREALKRGIVVKRVEVKVESRFGGPGEPARTMDYLARVEADADEHVIRELLIHTDTVAEIQNTLRKGIAVNLRIDGETPVEVDT